MPDSKITALTSISTSTDPANDPLVIVDVSDTSMAATGTTKKVTLNQLLGASGTATLASATITGDLTVDTNTLKVDSANNRVGIVNASPSFPLDLTGTGSNTPFRLLSGSGTSIRYDSTRNVGGLNRNWILGCDETAEGSFALLPSTTLGGSTFTNPVYRVTAAGVHTFFDGAGGTYATLNSTGLGVGTSPSQKLDIIGSLATRAATTGANQDVVSIRALNSDASAYANALYYANSQKWHYNGASLGMTLDSSGNVGIGVQPSAWNSTFKALQMGLGGSAYSQTGFNSVYLASNTFVDSGGNTKYINTDKATYYRQYDGIHSWFNAVSGTAGNAFTATQAMTLDASGSLVLGAAAVATTATDGFLYIPGCAGTPTGTPTAKTGRVPLVVDTTNNKLYFYSGGAWVAAN